MATHQEVNRLLNVFTARMAQTYGVEAVNRFFSIAAPWDTKLRDAIMHTIEFLSLINMQKVDQLTGQVVVTGNPGLTTGRKKDARFTRKMGVDGNTYTLQRTDSGSHLDYDTLTSWANAGSEDEFFQRIQDFSNKSFGLDILRIGFNGTHVAEDTDPEKYPNGEDVNIGWHQIVKTRSPGQIVSDAITLNRTGAPTNDNYVSLDAIVTDLRMNLIAEPLRGNPDLVALISADLLGADATSMMNRIDRPSEKVAAQMINREVGGLKCHTPPFMPDGQVIVTPLWNLHHYTQKGTEQKRAEWIDDRMRFENNWMRMEGYAVEYDEMYASFDNVTLPEDAAAA